MEAVIGAIIWILANAVYVDMRRRGRTGFKRLCAFWMGWPGTLVGMLSTDEASQIPMRRDDADLRELVREIRRDRLERPDAPATGPPSRPDPSASTPSNPKPDGS